MVIGECLWLSSWYKESDFDLSTISFTYGDTFPTFSDKVHDNLEYRKTVYAFDVILKIIEKYSLPQNKWNTPVFAQLSYVEVQVWSDNPIVRYIKSVQHETVKFRNWRCNMLRLRPYIDTDANTILSWCKNEVDFYKWTAGVLGTYPITKNEFNFDKSLMSFTAFDESGIVGFFTFRNPGKSLNELRFGFVIVDPEKRSKGYGKAMLQQGLKFAFEIYGAEKASLGVFENNPSAYHCYRAVGFQDKIFDQAETYHVMGEDWKCLELIMER